MTDVQTDSTAEHSPVAAAEFGRLQVALGLTDSTPAPVLTDEQFAALGHRHEDHIIGYWSGCEYTDVKLAAAGVAPLTHPSAHVSGEETADELGHRLRGRTAGLA